MPWSILLLDASHGRVNRGTNTSSFFYVSQSHAPGTISWHASGQKINWSNNYLSHVWKKILWGNIVCQCCIRRITLSTKLLKRLTPSLEMDPANRIYRNGTKLQRPPSRYSLPMQLLPTATLQASFSRTHNRYMIMPNPSLKWYLPSVKWSRLNSQRRVRSCY